MSLVLSPGLALTSIIFKPLNSLFFKIKSRNNIKEKMNIRKSENSIKLSLRNPGGDIKESETREPNKNIFSFSFKWAWHDSNLRPTDYESVALTN